MAEQLAQILKLKGVSVALIHRSLDVGERNEELDQFRNGHRVLAVATNAMARGVNITNVKIVINFEMPYHQSLQNFDTMRYLYRIGRSCHLGQQGIAINLVDGSSRILLDSLLNEHPMTQIET